MQVHSDDMVAASGLEHVGHQLSCDRCTALVLLILSRVREVGDDGGDAPGGGSFAGIDHDEELHQAIVDIVGSCGLENEDWMAAET